MLSEGLRHRKGRKIMGELLMMEFRFSIDNLQLAMMTSLIYMNTIQPQTTELILEFQYHIARPPLVN